MFLCFDHGWSYELWWRTGTMMATTESLHVWTKCSSIAIILNQWLLWRNTYHRVLLRGNKSHDSTGWSCHVMEQFLFIFRFTNLVLHRILQKDNEAHQSTIEKWCKYIRKMHQINQRFPLNINSLFCGFFCCFLFFFKKTWLKFTTLGPIYHLITPKNGTRVKRIRTAASFQFGQTHAIPYFMNIFLSIDEVQGVGLDWPTKGMGGTNGGPRTWHDNISKSS